MSPDYNISDNDKKGKSLKTVTLLFIIIVTLFSAENKILNQQAPGFRLKTVFGEATPYTALTPHFSADSSHAVILAFYANWCKPCMQELPFLQKVAEEKKEQGLRLIVVSVDSSFT